MILSNRAIRVIDFIETLKIPEGMHQGQPFVLREWQKIKYHAVYAPVWKSSCWNGECIGDDCQAKKKQTCIRVVRKAIYSVSKKQGKTPEVAAINLSHLIGPEAKRNEQLYSAAFERDQAGITYRYMVQMILMDEELTDNLIIRETKKEIFCPGTGSVFRALSSEIKGKHGLGPAVLTMDELAQFGADRTFYDTLQQGRGAHLEPLLWIISTQAADDFAVLSQEIDVALKAQEPGPDYDPTVKIFFYTTPPEADPFDPENWRLSNPALGDFLNMADMEEQARTAKNMPSAEGNFRNLRLNQRVDATEQFITPSMWEGCKDAPDPDEFEGREWYGGLDLSKKNDLTSLELVSKANDGIWDVLSHFWAPGDNLKEKEKRDRVPYRTWVKLGFLEAKPGKTIDYAWVAQKTGELSQKYNIVSIKFDRWKMEFLMKEFERLGIEAWVYGKGEGCDWHEDSKMAMPDGLKLVPHGQGFKDMDPAVQIVEDCFIDELLRHGDHPILKWNASNVRVISDPAEGRKFDKKKSIGRIDGIVALAMALNGAVTQEEEEESPYETQGLFLN